ncbi:dihydrolipoamide dehydrogenase [Caloramator quimbayensis]|uniref:Dihydrolipoyl dehydrogenase n=1 Tax=Caloramator quimbayensis TaxID=1147123 RepID=A0A1T4WUY5_9CLOT|nr:dihydrolipoyl dehydrogenase [Caloramator quimbayensis]SKA81190.1 dihydrolipoamide dehydrogenase [Caloramator quimbayensis]
MNDNKLNCQIAILGGGPAGYVAAIRASQLGANVVLVEGKELGGVCLNRGCIPTKALLKTSEVSYIIKKSKEFGIESSISNINWNSAIDRKNRVVKNLNMGLEHILPQKGIKVLKGKGMIKNPKKIIVSTDEGEIEVYCDKMIITSGSSPLMPNIEGINLPNVITSDEALNLDYIPKTMTIIGAGAIGLEFASMLSTLGCKITIIEMKDRILPFEDKEISNELLKIMKRQGIIFKLSSTVKSIREDNGLLKVLYSEENKENIVECEKVLVAIGRKLNSQSDEVKSLGLSIDKGAIVVNEHMETSIKGVYAAGDVVGGRLLAHIAFIEGKTAAENALGLDTTINYDAVPSCVYTNPEVASVGLNEEEAIKRGIKYKVGRFNFRNNGRALTLGEREGFVKIIIDEDNYIIGGQILGNNASEMISEITLSITLKAKADVIADMIHPHPSLSEAIWEACADALGRAIHKE